MANDKLEDLVVVLEDGDTFSTIRGTTAMLLAPGDARKLANNNEFVEPLDVYDLSDPVDLRRLADRLERNYQ